MPTEATSRRLVLDAIQSVPSLTELLAAHDGHYTYELDLEVTVYGRNYNGKKVGPYVRLLEYAPQEIVVREGEWGSNQFYVIVSGQAAAASASQHHATLGSGALFGHAALLAGVPQSATITASEAGLRVLEIQRPALRLLRKLPQFSTVLNESNRADSRDRALAALCAQLELTPSQAAELGQATRFITLSKQHVLVQQNDPATRLYFIKDGWLRRTQTEGRTTRTDIIGPGYCFGLRALSDNATWPYSITLLGRTELLEIAAVKLRGNTKLTKLLQEKLPQYRAPALPGADRTITAPNQKNAAKTALPILRARERLIETGLTDATNLLVMDMELCVRCGNCSLACHEMHGHSRLLRQGIALQRPQASLFRATQNLLAPEVCLHCQDPECLTGCPTGAIGRLSDGQIDINPSTCIGCGDCATQCPYDAISMLPRAEKQAATPPRNFSERVREQLRWRPAPLPPSVATVDDLVAVKCNLCSDRTTLNPPTAKTRKYSCEENCPTGALARVNPRNYFGELKQIEGKFFTTTEWKKKQAGGWWHPVDWPKQALHLAGLVSTLGAGALCWWGLQNYGFGTPLFQLGPLGMNMRWLTGLTGLFATALVLTYPLRRKIYRFRVGPLRYWLPLHTWSSVVAGLLIILHGGSHAGGWLTLTLMLSFDLVMLTGLFGMACYYIVPRLLTQLEETPLLLDDLLARRAELQTELTEHARQLAALPDFFQSTIAPRYLSLGFYARQLLRREPVPVLLQSAAAATTEALQPALQAALQKALQPLGLTQLVEKGLVALDDAHAEAFLKMHTNEPSHRTRIAATLDTLRQARTVGQAATRAAVLLRRVEALLFLQRLLKAWLPPHIITTALMLALLLVHLVQVFYFAAR